MLTTEQESKTLIEILKKAVQQELERSVADEFDALIDKLQREKDRRVAAVALSISEQVQYDFGSSMITIKIKKDDLKNPIR